jgi:cell division protein FtsW
MAQRVKDDWGLFGTIVALVMFGVVMVYSASSVSAAINSKPSMYYLVRQAGWAVFSLAVLMYMKKKNYLDFKTSKWAFGPLGAVVIALIAVYFLDPRSHRWVRLGIGSLQPSEFAKPALILFLSYFISRRMAKINDVRYTLLPAVGIAGVLFLFVGISDFGTALVLLVTAAAMFFVSGVHMRYVAIGGFAAIICLAGFILAKPYRINRIIGHSQTLSAYVQNLDDGNWFKEYLKNSAATGDSGYQARQSVIAVGAGGPVGRGPMRSIQKHNFLPEPHTDFIFAVIGEEFGLIGTTGVLTGFLVLLWRGTRLAWLGPDDYSRLLALGVTVSIVLQALINLSVVLDLGPTKGIPLPMISYGGSSLLSTLLSLGLLLSVSGHASE